MTKNRYIELQKTKLLNGTIGRRKFMMSVLAAGVALPSALSFAKHAAASTAKKGGSVKCAFNLHGPDDTLDPVMLTSDCDYARGRAHYNSLIQLSDDLSPQPELAASFGANADATEWSFNIRKDVAFHDGSKLTADDIVYSMNRHMGADSTSVAKGLFSVIKEWKKVGPYEVKAICETGYSDLPSILGEKHFKIVKDGTTDFINPVGTGPYKLESMQPGIGSVHVRNEDYWREGANFDSIELFGITDNISRVSAVLSGDVDMIISIPPNALQQIESADDLDLISTPSGSYMGIGMHSQKEYGSNPDFVMAMKHLQRRERIVKTLLKGHGTVGNDNPINSAYGVDFCSDLPINAYDPDRAKSLLKKSGITSAVMEAASVSPGAVEMCLLLQRECQKIGFNLEVKKVPTDGYWSAVWQKTPMHTTAWNMRPTASIMLDMAYHPDAPWSDTFWKDERMGDLLHKVKGETDPKNRHALQCEMQTIVTENAPVVIPAHTAYLDAKSSKVHGVSKLPLGSLGGGEWVEFAWLES